MLANAGFVVGGSENTSSGVSIEITVGPTQPAGPRLGTAKISAVGAAPCVAASPFCDNATRPEDGAVVTATFAVLATEPTLALRVLVDRVLVEAFVQRGRVAFTKSFIPRRWQDSAVPLLAAASGGGGGGEALLTVSRVSVWSMGCGWVNNTEGGGGLAGKDKPIGAGG